MSGMTIGRAADVAGLPVKTVRYYADIGLIEPQGRSASGYRVYGGEEVARLAFVRRARAFGFSVEECRELLGLYDDRSRASADVKRIALDHLTQIDARLAELQRLRDELQRLANACAGDERADCPILGAMAG
jgi:MerR family copper efflux transcriptional regulator